LVKKSRNGLFELCQSGSCRNNPTAKPKSDTQTEAAAISYFNEIGNLFKQSPPAFAVAVKGMMNLLNIASD